jgi:hypothetical protein
MIIPHKRNYALYFGHDSSRETSVDHHRMPRDPRRFVGGEEQDSRSDISRLTKAAERMESGQSARTFFIRENACDKWGSDEPRAYAVHADIPVGVVESHVTGKSDQCGLCGAVSGSSAYAGDAGH